jgi:hypothetical protein
MVPLKSDVPRRDNRDVRSEPHSPRARSPVLCLGDWDRDIGGVVMYLDWRQVADLISQTTRQHRNRGEEFHNGTNCGARLAHRLTQREVTAEPTDDFYSPRCLTKRRQRLARLAPSHAWTSGTQ